TNPDGPQHWLKVGYLDRAALWLDHNGQLNHSAAGAEEAGAALSSPPPQAVSARLAAAATASARPRGAMRIMKHLLHPGPGIVSAPDWSRSNG
ncbi:hypothetical protein, partial [Microbispora rosea]